MGKLIECAYCSGTGGSYITKDYGDADEAHYETEWEACGACGGEGKYEEEDLPFQQKSSI